MCNIHTWKAIEELKYLGKKIVGITTLISSIRI